VGDGDAALGHDPDQISIAKPICEVPADAQLNDFRLKSAAPVDGIASDGLGHMPFRKQRGFSSTLTAPEPEKAPSSRAVARTAVMLLG
jgi:hypothetical protein